MVRAQLLSELEEVIMYKQYADQPERQQVMCNTWMKRLQGCLPDVEVWDRILRVRTLIIKPEDDPIPSIKFANLCRKSDRMILAGKTIDSLLTPKQTPPNIVHAQLKYMWARGAREGSLAELRLFGARLAKDFEPWTSDHAQRELLKQCGNRLSKLLARLVEDVLQCYLLATSFDESWYKAWHTWAMVNFNVVNQMDPLAEVRAMGSLVNNLRHIGDALPDTLRLLILWFKLGAHDKISHGIASGFSMVKIDTWLPAHYYPSKLTRPTQIIARIPHEHPRNINNLLTEVGKSHPQALIYPLTVESKSPSEEQGAPIVEQARIVSCELSRVAILWHELWHEGLKEVSRLYAASNRAGMLSVLEPLYEMLEAGSQTVQEIAFNRVFGTQLRHAREACRRYRQFGEALIYLAFLQEIEKQLPQLTPLDLQYVSPVLLNAHNLDLAVPGTYQGGGEIAYISNFTREITIIPSKHRPRRMVLKGSDGRDYEYVLKGHVDLRQDERVMQLFSLLNTLKRRLHVQRYPVIPLALNVGLIGTIQQSDTLHELVRDYRHSIKLPLNNEYQLMVKMAPNYENLPLLEKTEMFKYTMDNTSGQDLYKILWLKIGYILGFGNRHPSNMMVERKTGKVVHIDFVDCFEVAMRLDEFPEKVPFRLTKMLTCAMEVTGIEGSFQKTCEISMGILRDNQEVLMAVLETFVYNPLISWQLVPADVGVQQREGASVLLASH
ncbi:kinase-like domain-containing protein [Mycena capillaripes]|nr:kinase-like domain-containing protein [Mycena capillaripes]